MSDVAEVARSLTKAQREALLLVCKTNGGGVRIACKVGDDGYGIPKSSIYRKLHDLGLVQGKSGGYETVVHTRDGLAVRQYLQENPDA